MLQPRIEDCLANVSNKYELAIVAAKRSKEKMAHVSHNTMGAECELTAALYDVANRVIVPSISTF